MGFSDFTRSGRGYYRSFRGKTYYVGPLRLTEHELDARWHAVKQRADTAARVVPARTGAPSYREVLSEFLTAMELRVTTGKPKPLSPRTLLNLTGILNDFGRHVDAGRSIEDVAVDTAGFSSYAAKYGAWKASGFDSIVTRVGQLFSWARDMEYIARYRPGPQFQRPAKSVIVHERLQLTKMFSPAEVKRLWEGHSSSHKQPVTSPLPKHVGQRIHSGPLIGSSSSISPVPPHREQSTHCNSDPHCLHISMSISVLMRCWIGAGVCCAFTNTDLAHLPRDVLDLSTGVIDYRRRKTGKVRRVCVLPEDVLREWRAYRRPDPADEQYADRFFLTARGLPYGGVRGAAASDPIQRLFYKHEAACGVAHVKGRGFSGLRTTCFNLWPRGEYGVERRLVMGRAVGRAGEDRLSDVDWHSYLESLSLDRIRFCVNAVWEQVSGAGH